MQEGGLVGRLFSWFKVPIKLATTNFLFGPCRSPCGPRMGPGRGQIAQGDVNKGGKSLDTGALFHHVPGVPACLVWRI